jgi:hypothetical protein
MLIDNHLAGDPMSYRKWVRLSTYRLSAAIRQWQIDISANTTGRLLKKMDISLKANKKDIAATQHPDRNLQFETIDYFRNQFKQCGLPTISVDMKKKELVGNFKNPGQVYCKQAEKVFDHDFPSQASGKANPYGIYEPLTDLGTVVVGTSFDTAEFAVESIQLWLTNFGFKRYENFKKLLILCDSGGSNGYRTRAWKYCLHQLICKKFNISVTVCHYPTGASKWNPVEHRLFSYISKNWAGVPLRSYEIILNYIKDTSTKSGLKVNSILNNKLYKKGVKISDKEFQKIKLEKYETLPLWNYTIHP